MTPAQVKEEVAASITPPTPEETLSALSVVDGAGSGLDADAIRGLSPAQVAALTPLAGGSGGHASARRARMEYEVEKRVAVRTSSDRLLRHPEVIRLTGLSRATIDRLERAGDFPKRVQVSRNAVAWHGREVLVWKANRPRSR